MSVPVETLRTHLKYTSWATARVVEAASALTPEELTRDHRSADRHVLGTLVHVYAADRAWLQRVEGRAPEPFMVPERDLHLRVLQHDWPALLERWQTWAAALPDASPLAHYQDLQGRPHATPLWQIVLHVVNHATHHRGQAAAMMRAMGHTPPPLDLIRFYREVPLSAADDAGPPACASGSRAAGSPARSGARRGNVAPRRARPAR